MNPHDESTQRCGRYVKLAWICLAFLTSCACPARSQAQQFDDLLGTTIDLPWPERAVEIPAPIIVVASVIANESVGPPTEAKRIAGLMLQLHRVDCTLENSIKGNRPEYHFHFFYFADPELPRSASNEHYTRAYRFQAMAGNRYIFFLFKERGNLRSVGDVGPFSLPVFSGRHTSAQNLTLANPFANHELGRIVADILLTPGEGFDPATFSPHLDWAATLAGGFDNRLEIARRLRELVKQPEPLRTEACLRLARHFQSQYGCLREIVADRSVHEGKRASYAGLLAKEEAYDKILEGLLQDPAAIPIDVLNGDSWIADYDELEILLGSPNPEIRRLTCVALHRYYPRTLAAQDCGKNATPP